MALIHWPRTPLFKIRGDVSIDDAPRSVTGPPAVDGQTQAVMSSAGVWSMSYGDVFVSGDAGIMLWRALAVQINGRANAIVMPIFERPGRTPGGAGYAAQAAMITSSPHGDDALHSDDTAYAGTSTEASVASPVERGALAWTLNISGATPLSPGSHFSVGYRLYRVAYIVSEAAGVTTLRAWPPARDAVLAGSVVALADLVCKVRLAADRGMALPVKHYNRHGVATTLSLVEDLR